MGHQEESITKMAILIFFLVFFIYPSIKNPVLNAEASFFQSSRKMRIHQRAIQKTQAIFGIKGK